MLRQRRWGYTRANKLQNDQSRTGKRSSIMKTIVITGASSGIGKATAKYFAN
ncbi:hypothetical protein [Limosilactobacillus fermentum]|uniref:hypothetical protein n=1 Tax=Limosilactobacillus fermentum TaxID=1613 RepID=UPI001432FF05|nr:hypothetical protein [Limosilactobacillus fermentum]